MRKVVWTGYWTSRLHREAVDRSTILVSIKMTGAPKGYRRCPESIYRSAEPFLQGKYRADEG